MRLISKYSIVIFLWIISCQKEITDHCINQTKIAEGYIIGFDPCTINQNYDTGFVIITTDLNDTLVTYNFPDTVFYFPPEYFQNYRNSAYFPDSALDDFKTRVKYRKAKENELNQNACSHDINANDFYRQFDNNQVIIISAIRY